MFGRFIVGRCKQILDRSVAVNATENWLTTAFLRRPVSLVSNAQLISSRKCHHLGPQVQKMAPVFKGTAVINGDFKEIDICDYRGKYLVLFFYPLDFTFVCPTEIIAFSDRIDEFKAINTDVIGVSCDSHFSHLAWINTPRKHGGLGELKYPLLSDFNKSIARDYNVLLEADGVPLRGLFIIDPQGVVRQITVNDLPVGRSVDEVLRLVKAFQFTDKHGEVVCVRPESKGDKEKSSKFSVRNIKPKSSYETREKSVMSVDETPETRDLSSAQLERLVLLDQMKFYKMQLEEHRKKKDQKKKEEKKSVSLLEERDALSV